MVYSERECRSNALSKSEALPLSSKLNSVNSLSSFITFQPKSVTFLILLRDLIYFANPLPWLIFLEFIFIACVNERNCDGTNSSPVEPSVVSESVQVLVNREILMVQLCKQQITLIF
jgi:hypothetical protein